ncbi:hypothetical protein TWF730_001343 [Orbilia blumenaviensis]|uniref:Uncharacterized protein n=1 Tax=Orbilia blumenaviensis TaxID=1796055 RepID=A0AAV9UIB6_9PEZI
MKQLSAGEICGIIIATILALCSCIGVLIWMLQWRRDKQKSGRMVTMTGTTIRNKNGDVSVMEATWIPNLAVPRNSYYSKDSRRGTLSDGSSDTGPVAFERSAPSSLFPRAKRTSHVSAKRLEIPEVLTEEEDLEYDNSSSEKGGADSPSVESGAVTPAEIQAPTIHIQDVDDPSIRSTGFEKSFDIDNLLQSVKDVSTDSPNKKEAIQMG